MNIKALAIALTLVIPTMANAQIPCAFCDNQAINHGSLIWLILSAFNALQPMLNLIPLIFFAIGGFLIFIRDSVYRGYGFAAFAIVLTCSIAYLGTYGTAIATISLIALITVTAVKFKKRKVLDI